MKKQEERRGGNEPSSCPSSLRFISFFISHRDILDVCLGTLAHTNKDEHTDIYRRLSTVSLLLTQKRKFSQDFRKCKTFTAESYLNLEFHDKKNRFSARNLKHAHICCHLSLMLHGYVQTYLCFFRSSWERECAFQVKVIHGNGKVVHGNSHIRLVHVI